MKEFDASLIPSAREIQENQESSVVAGKKLNVNNMSLEKSLF